MWDVPATGEVRFQRAIFATTRDELLECAALVRAIEHGELDRIMIPGSPLDILAQQIVAAIVAVASAKTTMER